jgi:outer membrane protein OmpA-like peptidoglycan-associated protein
MVRLSFAGAVLALFLATPVLADNAEFVAELGKDAAKAADSNLVGRYEGAFIVGQTKKAFDELTLANGPAAGEEYDDGKAFTSTLTAQGKVTRTLYVAPQGRSSLEVFGNYVDDLKGKGFTPVYECAKEACGPSFKVLTYRWDNKQTLVVSEGADTIRTMASQAMFDSVIDPRYALLKSGEAGNETYVAVFAAQNQGGSYGDMSQALQDRVGVLLQIVEPKARETKIVTLSADEIGADLANTGRVVLYGIYFDFDKSVIKPESQEQLDQMQAYLDSNPDVKVYVTGHTDNQGGLDYNLKLSGARAIAVSKALAKAGVDAKRMTPKAVGPLAPLASNDDEEGRAKNRRVELVKQ